MFFALRVPLERILERLERDGPEAVAARRDVGDRPVDLELTGVVDAVFRRSRTIRISRVHRRIERLERVERAVGHHRNALLRGASVPKVAHNAGETQDGSCIPLTPGREAAPHSDRTGGAM